MALLLDLLWENGLLQIWRQVKMTFSAAQVAEESALLSPRLSCGQ
jgi:hypothetical protein